MTKDESMRGLFFIVRGQYNKKGLQVMCSDGETRHIGGYDPEDDTNDEWYFVMDNTVFFTICCGSSIDKALEMIRTYILKYKTRKNYFREVSRLTSEDYYEVHYLHHPPLTPEKRAKKAEGRCPRTSPPMKALWTEVFREYGDYYSDLVQEVEDSAYDELRKDNVVTRGKEKRKKLTLSTPQETPQETPKTPVHEEVSAKKRPVMKRKKVSLKFG